MCRSIKTLRPPYAERVTDEDMHAAALQYVRKVSGFRAPAAHNADAFNEAVEAVTRPPALSWTSWRSGAPRQKRRYLASRYPASRYPASRYRATGQGSRGGRPVTGYRPGKPGAARPRPAGGYAEVVTALVHGIVGSPVPGPRLASERRQVLAAPDHRALLVVGQHRRGTVGVQACPRPASSASSQSIRASGARPSPAGRWSRGPSREGRHVGLAVTVRQVPGSDPAHVALHPVERGVIGGDRNHMKPRPGIGQPPEVREVIQLRPPPGAAEQVDLPGAGDRIPHGLLDDRLDRGQPGTAGHAQRSRSPAAGNVIVPSGGPSVSIWPGPE